MKYMGSKARYAKHIIPHLIKYRTPGQYYVEPFVGGASIISEIDSPRIGADINKYIIAMWQAVATGWVPKKSYSKRDYDHIKNNPDENPVLTGYLGCVQSFGGKFLDTYGRSVRDCDASGQHISAVGYINAMNQFPKLQGVKFYCCSYDKLKVPPKSIIYCDPPYANTTGYTTGDFDSIIFWEWADRMTNLGHRVIVSEYEAPEGWEVLWNKKVTISLNNVGRKSVLRKLERLFIKPSYK